VIEVTHVANHPLSLECVANPRNISTALRSGVLIAAGAGLILAPTLVGLSVAAIVTGLAVGILAIALGIASTDTQGRGTLSVSAQALFDRGLALGLLGSAVAFGAVGDRDAVALFGALGLTVLLVAVTTRYTVRPA
jgi:hypothetical protein